MVKSKALFKDLEVHTFKTYAQWLKWLEKNFDRDAGVWIRFGKKGSGLSTISYEEARECAIIYGWIDGQICSFDEQSYLRKFTPRRKKSMWSKINRRIAEKLIRDKRIAPSGLAEVKAAKKDGRWDAAYDSPSTIKIPAEFQKRLNDNPKAKRFFSSLDKTNRYSILVRIQMAKTASSKTKLMDKAIDMLNQGKTHHPSREGKKKTRWCVLLRGINVGGKRSVKMAELREQLEKKKFQDVETYIQSGNVILSSEKSASAIEMSIKKLVKDKWTWDIEVQAFDEKELKRIVKGNPFANLDQTKIHVVRLSKKVTTKDASGIKKYIGTKEQVKVKGNLIYLLCPDGLSKTKLSNAVIERVLKVSSTARNWKTINKLIEMMG